LDPYLQAREVHKLTASPAFTRRDEVVTTFTQTDPAYKSLRLVCRREGGIL
jgi:hypothetical protein